MCYQWVGGSVVCTGEPNQSTYDTENFPLIVVGGGLFHPCHRHHNASYDHSEDLHARCLAPQENHDLRICVDCSYDYG
jgi:hypothetical protein